MPYGPLQNVVYEKICFDLRIFFLQKILLAFLCAVCNPFQNLCTVNKMWDPPNGKEEVLHDETADFPMDGTDCPVHRIWPQPRGACKGIYGQAG